MVAVVSSELELRRSDVKVQLATALRMFAALDFDEGAAGHLSVRDPIDPDLFWVNAFGVPFELTRASDLVLVDHAGNVYAGAGAPSRSALTLHRAVYAAQPAVQSAMHAHPVHTKAWSALGRRLEPINQEACIFTGCHDVYDAYDGPFSDEHEAPKVAAMLGDNIALVLRNHGLLTVGGSVGAAAYRFMIFDRSVRVQLIAEAAGPTIPIATDVAAKLAVQEVHCEQSFEPWLRSLLAREPELAT
jgi:ribulose-5-phosphate 4-epimerase/fuculose-1-phosphate aldolase